MDIEEIARHLLEDDADRVLAESADTQTFVVNTLERAFESMHYVTEEHCRAAIRGGTEPTLELGFLRLYSEPLYLTVLKMALKAMTATRCSTAHAIAFACNTLVMHILLHGLHETERDLGFLLEYSNAETTQCPQEEYLHIASSSQHEYNVHDL